MRVFFGLSLLVVGLATLFYYGRAEFAPKIQSKIQASADAVLDGRDDVSARVTGRRLVVSGETENQDEKDAVLALMRDVPGARNVVDDIALPKPISPYRFEGRRVAGELSLFGNAPTRASIGAVLGARSAEVKYGPGAPDENWAQVVGTAILALEKMENGRFVLENNALRVVGMPKDLETELAVQDVLNTLPGGYDLTFDVAAGPVAPYVFSGVKSAGQPQFKGFVPSRNARAALATVMGSGAADRLVLARGAPNDNWQAAVSQAAKITHKLFKGEVSLTGTELLLNGTAPDPVIADEINAMLADLPEGYSVAGADLDIRPVVPYTFTAERVGMGVSVEGYVSDLESREDLRDLLGAEADSIKIGAGAPNGQWLAAVQTGLQALDSTETGKMRLSDLKMVIEGEVANPETRAAMADILSSLPEGFGAEVDVIELDDGAPLSLNIVFADGGSPTVSGKTPKGLGFQQVAKSLNLPDLAGDVVESRIDDGGALQDQLATLAPVLPLLESASIQLGEAGEAAQAVLRPGQAAENVQTVMRDVFGEAAPLELLRSPNQPDEGATRLDPETGKTETYALGKWTQEPDPASGTLRTNPETGRKEIFDGGRWVKAPTEGDQRFDAESGRTQIFANGVWTIVPDEGEERRTANGRLEVYRNGAWELVPLTGDTRRREDGRVEVFTSGDWVLIPADGDTRLNAENGREEIYEKGIWVVMPQEGDTRSDPTTGRPVMFKNGVWELVPQEGDTRSNPDNGVTEVFANGTWEAVPEPEATLTCPEQTDALLNGRIVTFLTGSDQLTEDGVGFVTEIGKVISGCADLTDYTLEIGGHTDSQGNAAFNADLSLKRATTVGLALVEQGVTPTIIVAKGYGEAEPVASNATAEGRAQNRRITLRWAKN